MDLTRRSFVATAAAGVAAGRSLISTKPLPTQLQSSDRFDPWLEIDSGAIRHNVREVSRLTGGKPILAVTKNNAYGLGLVNVASILSPLPEIAGFAVVKADEAATLKDGGVSKPVLLMGMFSPGDGRDLLARRIELSLYTDDALQRLAGISRPHTDPVGVHLYLDTGMSRMGMPFHRALPWIANVSSDPRVNVRGTFMAFVEETEIDAEQIRRFRDVVTQAKGRNLSLGKLHAASSNGVFHLPQAHFDMVRPGIAIYGAYPSDFEAERAKGDLIPAVRFRARVVRVERLRAGDGVSYGYNYVAQRPTWIATLPVGHVDGYPRRATAGAQVLINGKLFPVIGAVSASHSIVELGDEPAAQLGDVATLMGPDAPEIHPNVMANTIGVSVYDLLMHLNPGLPRYVV